MESHSSDEYHTLQGKFISITFHFILFVLSKGHCYSITYDVLTELFYFILRHYTLCRHASLEKQVNIRVVGILEVEKPLG